MSLQSKDIVIKITGDSGDGIQLVGEQLTIEASLKGYDVRTEPDFPAEIRAPQGTTAGVSGFQLAMAEHAIFTAGETLDVLVALNPAALKKALPYLKEGGLLILNEDSLTAKDFEKANLAQDILSSVKEHYHLITLPLVTNTVKALENLTLTNTQVKKAKNFYILGVVLWLFELSVENCKTFINKKFKKNPQVSKANIMALEAGYNYALTLELTNGSYILEKIKRPAGEYRQITGVEATSLAIATIATMTNKEVLVAGYPITPASAILHEAAKLSKFGLKLFQAEDEIAAICACIGASFGGNLALTVTSGPGFDLKSESLGLAVTAELPLVVIDVQRAGSSTGMPTKTGQSDLRQALYGRHAEAPLPVIAAKTPGDCFYTVIEAFKYAIKYMTPVIVLLDAYLTNAAEPWAIPDIDGLDIEVPQYNKFPKPYMRFENLSRSWNIPGEAGFIHQIGGLEKEGEEGKVSYDSANHQKMVNLRFAKVSNVANDYQEINLEGDSKAPVLVIGWGSTYGNLKTLIQNCEESFPIALLHLRNLHPLPKSLPDILKNYKVIYVAELNSGHLCDLIRARYLVNAIPINQINGQSFNTSFLIENIKEHYKREFC